MFLLQLLISYSMVGKGHMAVSMVTGDEHAPSLAEHVEEAKHQAQSSSNERLVLTHVEQSGASAEQPYSRTGITAWKYMYTVYFSIVCLWSSVVICGHLWSFVISPLPLIELVEFSTSRAYSVALSWSTQRSFTPALSVDCCNSPTCVNIWDENE